MPAMGIAPRIVVVGLGYVGLPLAVALARKFEATGFDLDSGPVDELKGGTAPGKSMRMSFSHPDSADR